MFTIDQMEIIAFCAYAVDEQQDKPWRVYGMLKAWNMVAEDFRAVGKYVVKQKLTSLYVQEIGRFVSPDKGHYRSGPVTINNKIVGIPHQEVLRVMNTLFTVEALTALDPLQVYIEFEKIHPFSDGNGRVGLIIFNALNGTIENPIRPEVGNIFA